MAARHPTARKSARPGNKKSSSGRSRKKTALAGRSSRGLGRPSTKRKKQTVPRREGASKNPNEAQRRNGTASFVHPKNELEAAIQRYIELYDFAPIAYVSFDRVGRVAEANLAVTRLLGGNRHSIVGAPFSLRIYKPDADLFLKHLLRCRASHNRVDSEMRLKNREGRMIPVQLSSVPTASSMRDGSLLYQTAIFDLTARMEANEALRRSQARYRTLFDLVPVAVYTSDADGLILEFNQQAAALWGREPKTNDPVEKFCGSFKIFYPDGRVMPHHKCPMARALRGEILKAADSEIVVEQRDGTRRDVVVSPTTLKNDQGKIIGAINCLFDITERKQAHNALRESEELYRAFVNQTAVGMIRTDLKGRLVFANKRFCEIIGFTESELIGKNIRDLIPDEYVAMTMKLFRRLLVRGTPYHQEKRYLRKDGSLVWVKVSASPLRDSNGKMQGTVAVIRDIGERKEAQAELERAKQFLEERVRDRTSELVAANEELRNEISRRKGLEGEILEISDREQQQLGRELHDGICQHLTAVAFMAHSVAARLKNHRVIEIEDIEKIGQLIQEGANDARDIARSLHSLDVDSVEFMPALRDLVSRKIWRTPCRLEVEASLDVSDHAASQLFRIVREAIINANKHARARVITVKVAESRDETVVSISDDGVGIRGNRRKKGGMGFHIMNYRAQSIGARLEIRAIRPHGTRVSCYLQGE
jgi:PAS domain S-box-containing protein